jgi:bifunctional non-homologous end joining protein LigD
MTVDIPSHCKSHQVTVDGRVVKLTNLQKVFWPESAYTKRDLLLYYVNVADALLPHLRNRAMVMKRYPNGIEGEFFFMKRTPAYAPEWLETCSIEHASKSVIAFPMVQDLASLLWVVNLGCIDLNQWYAACDDTNRPDYMHFDLDPTPGAEWAQVLEAALVVRDELAALSMKSYPKTTGSRGIHVYVPIERGPLQKQVWTFAKSFARSLARKHPQLITAEYRVAKRPERHILVDYNQNAWGRTLASVYSLRPKPGAPVSTPLDWSEVEAGVRLEDFTISSVPARVAERGDLFKPLLAKRGRVKLEPLLAQVKAA